MKYWNCENYEVFGVGLCVGAGVLYVVYAVRPLEIQDWYIYLVYFIGMAMVRNRIRFSLSVYIFIESFVYDHPTLVPGTNAH